MAVWRSGWARTFGSRCMRLVAPTAKSNAALAVGRLVKPNVPMTPPVCSGLRPCATTLRVRPTCTQALVLHERATMQTFSVKRHEAQRTRHGQIPQLFSTSMSTDITFETTSQNWRGKQILTHLHNEQPTAQAKERRTTADHAATREGTGKGKAGKSQSNKGKTDQGKGNKGKGAGKADNVIGTGSKFDDFMSTVRATEKLHKKNWTPPGF